MLNTNPKVDDFLNKTTKWREEMRELRRILLACCLTEEFKWKQPCYAYQRSNIVVIGGFKEYVALLLFNGALLQNTEGLLVQPTENSQAGRQMRFTSVQEILDIEATIKAYIYEAIEAEKAGLKVDFKKTSDFDVPEEVQNIFDQDASLKTAFEALTPGRQRGYLLHFAGAKQSKTRISRVDGCRDRIMSGKGLRDCICGLSKKYPVCDGSHQSIM